MAARSLLLLCALSVLWSESSESVCTHGGAGPTSRISLGKVRAAQAAVRERVAGAVEKASRLSLDTPFDSGLPACGVRRVRAVRVDMPRELVGRTIAFAPAGRMPRADLRVATSASRLADLEADALAHAALAERLGVRCAPTLVRVRSEAELELVENP